MEDLVLFLFYVGGLNVVLLIGCLIADYVFPHIPFIERYLDSLPDWDEDCEEVSTVDKKVREQIMVIRDSGKVNMMDAQMVQRIADVRGFLELSLFLQGHRQEYTHFIFTREEVSQSD